MPASRVRRPDYGTWRLSRNWFLIMPIRVITSTWAMSDMTVDVFVEEYRELGLLVAHDLDEQVVSAAHPHDVDDGRMGLEPLRERGAGATPGAALMPSIASAS